jgi:hypothetical protein
LRRNGRPMNRSTERALRSWRGRWISDTRYAVGLPHFKLGISSRVTVNELALMLFTSLLEIW